MADQMISTVDQAITQIDAFLLTSLSLFDDLPIGAVVLDAEGRFVRVNECFADYLDTPQDEITGRGFLEFVHPDYLTQHLEIAERLRMWISADKPSTGPQLPSRVTNEYRRSDGSYVRLHWLRPRREALSLPTGLHVGFCISEEEASCVG